MSNTVKVLLTILASAVAALISAFVPAPYTMPVLAVFASVCLHYGISFGPTAAKAVDVAAKKAPSVPPLPMFMLALMLVVPLALFCSACGLFRSSGPAAPVAACAPTPDALEQQVASILLDGTDYLTKLDELAKQLGKDGLSSVICAAAYYRDELDSGKVAASPARLAAKERASAYLASKGAK